MMTWRIWRKSSLQASTDLYLLLGKKVPPPGWLHYIPIENMGFTLHKRAFRDAVFFRYGWTPPFLSTNCIWGKAFSMEHALSCNRGAFPSTVKMRFAIWLLSFSLRYATMFAWNPAWKSSTKNTSNYGHVQQLQMITQGWTSVPMAFGKGQKGHSLMYWSKHQLGICCHYMRWKEETVRWLSSGSRTRKLYTSGLCHIWRHGKASNSFSFTNALRPCSYWRRTSPIAKWLVQSDAAWVSLFNPPSPAWGLQGPLQDSFPVPPIPMLWTSQSVRVRWQCHKLQYKLLASDIEQI